MTIDETIRAFCYFIKLPAYTYLGLVNWNRSQRDASDCQCNVIAVLFLAFSRASDSALLCASADAGLSEYNNCRALGVRDYLARDADCNGGF
ncbi:MAG: hypothetical protein IPJ48_16755 [Propionivibrio sp.]|uniref:Uncharacterized protein n=1 Tax=Candidatus Propionivibrio dominans TaxID=2954373 RepID=A0A9D7IDY1_9RHOO|nr:hypothetical protein [Candidatus Propionivibrio dominans]